MPRIMPTIGRKLWYWPSNAEQYGVIDLKQPFDATVCCVSEGGDRVNLAIHDHHGRPSHVGNVLLMQEGEAPPPGGGYAEWMPYQIGQAKTGKA